MVVMSAVVAIRYVSLEVEFIVVVDDVIVMGVMEVVEGEAAAAAAIAASIFGIRLASRAGKATEHLWSQQIGQRSLNVLRNGFECGDGLISHEPPDRRK